MTNVAHAPLGPGETYRSLRELGRRARRTFAVIREPHELLVLQRFVREGFVDRTGSESSIRDDRPVLPIETAEVVSAEEIANLLRDARSLEKNWHPNLARVKNVSVSTGGDLRVATELIDGATLGDLLTAAASRAPRDRDRVLPLGVLLRVLVDVLSGLQGLHGLRDGMNAPLGAMHGELCPTNVVVGRDGVARVVAALRPRPVRLREGSEATGYAAPEMTDAAATPDARADLYAVGVMLWEALTGKRLFPEADLAAVAQTQRSEDLAEPEVPASASAFAPLAEVALRALAFDPALRFRSASEMAAEIRRIAGSRLAPGSVVAQTVAELAGDRIRARRAELDPVASGTRRRATASVPDEEPDSDRATMFGGDTTAEPTPPVRAATRALTDDDEPPPTLDPTQDPTGQAADDDEDEVTQVHPNAPRPTARPPGDSEVETPDVPRSPRLSFESVDEHALAKVKTPAKPSAKRAAGEPSTARIKTLDPPKIADAEEPPSGAQEIDAADILEDDDEETAVGVKAPVLVDDSPRPPPVKPNVPRAAPRPPPPAAKPAPAAKPTPAATPTPAPVAKVQDIDRSDIPRMWAESSTDLEERSPSIVPAPPPRSAANRTSATPPAAAATSSAAPATTPDTGIPRLWSDSVPEFPSTNVLEGDFVRALKAAASEPPSAAARKSAAPNAKKTSSAPETPAAPVTVPDAAPPAAEAAAPPIDVPPPPPAIMAALDKPPVFGVAAPAEEDAEPRELSSPSLPDADAPEEASADAPTEAAPRFPVPDARASEPSVRDAPSNPFGLAEVSAPLAPPGLDTGAPDAHADARRKKRIVTAIAGACGLLLVVIGIARLFGDDSSERATTTPEVATSTPTSAEDERDHDDGIETTTSSTASAVTAPPATTAAPNDTPNDTNDTNDTNDDEPAAKTDDSADDKSDESAAAKADDPPAPRRPTVESAPARPVSARPRTITTPTRTTTPTRQAPSRPTSRPKRPAFEPAGI